MKFGLFCCAFWCTILATSIEANSIKERNLFATELFHTIAATRQNENVIISPVAIQTALALMYYGADGNTSMELQKTLHATEDQSRFGIAKSYQSILHSFVKSKATLQIANKIYAKDGVEIHPGFLNVAQKYFDSDIVTMDFTNEQQTVENINKWLVEKTNGKIQKIIENFDPDTTVALLNAIYFKAKWARPFMDDETSARDFWLSSDKSVKVPTMYADNWYNYAEYPELNAQALELFFENTDLAMWFILPYNRTGLYELEQKMKSLDFKALDERWEWKSVKVYLPKFAFEFATDLKSALTKLGIMDMFTSAANFGHIFKQSPVNMRISEFQHKSFIDVNEIGCEAAAASVGVGTPMSLPFDPKTFKADHPFVFIIRDKRAIYFTGHITKFYKIRN